MFHRPILAACVSGVLLSSGPAYADSAALFDALGLPEIITIMQQEGIDYGAEIAADLFPQTGTSRWDEAVAEVYDMDRMQDGVKADFVAALDGQDVAPMLLFFTTEPGKSLVGREVSARRAMLDAAVDEASMEAADIAKADNTADFQRVRSFIDANDLVESNVAGAMNANVAFYMGLMAGGALDGTLTEDQILMDVWDQEDDVRTSTTDWLTRFLLLAFGPAEDADIEAYIAFSQTTAGRTLNTVLFTAFDRTFDGISYDLGYEAGRMIATQEL